MRPLLKRLRDPAHAEADEPSSLSDLCREAADEIEDGQDEIARLRTALNTLDKNLQLQQWSIRVSLGTLKR